MDARRLYLAVGTCAVVVYVGALWNRFAWDDLYIVVLDPLVHSPSGLWRAFGVSYWAGNLNTTVYRPLTVASYVVDWAAGGATAWFHAVNLLWHAAASVMVAVLARRWAGGAAGLVAGMLFAVHPVHVEAVANVVGRNELMAALFTLVAVYAALERGSVLWSTAAMAAGLLSKENAAVAPGLIAFAWLVGLRPLPSRRTLAAFAASWVLVACAYGGLRWAVLHSYGGVTTVAPVFVGQSPLTVRLTALAALADVARLLVFPLHLRGDYSPGERTAITSALDPRLVLGLLALAVWGSLLAFCWRRGRRVEAFGLGWVGIAYAPVANLLFPIGVLLAERTLYLPSAGLALAVGAWVKNLAPRRLAVLTGLVLVAGGARTALRVPVWRDNRAASLALLEDAPRSYRAWDYLGWEYLWAGKTAKALEAFRRAAEIYDRDARIYLAAADAAFALGRYGLADSLLAGADRACERCVTAYRNQAGAARLRGDSVSADSLLARARRVATP